MCVLRWEFNGAIFGVEFKARGFYNYLVKKRWVDMAVMVQAWLLLIMEALVLDFHLCLHNYHMLNGNK